MNKSEFNDFSLLTLENEALRERIKTMKMDVNSLRKSVISFLQDLETTNLIQGENIVLTPEDRERLLKIIEKVIKTN
jgi:hypothetical protein